MIKLHEENKAYSDPDSCILLFGLKFISLHKPVAIWTK